MNIQTAISLGGTINPEENTSHLVSYYHIPGGYDYEMAYPVNAYFDCIENAEKFFKSCRSEQLAIIIPYKA